MSEGFDNLIHTTIKGKVVYKRPKHTMTDADRKRIIKSSGEIDFTLEEIVKILTNYTNKHPILEWQIEANAIFIREIVFLALNLFGPVLMKFSMFTDVFQNLFYLVKAVGPSEVGQQKDKMFEEFLFFFSDHYLFPQWFIDFLRWAFYNISYTTPDMNFLTE